MERNSLDLGNCGNRFSRASGKIVATRSGMFFNAWRRAFAWKQNARAEGQDRADAYLVMVAPECWSGFWPIRRQCVRYTLAGESCWERATRRLVELWVVDSGIGISESTTKKYSTNSSGRYPGADATGVGPVWRTVAPSLRWHAMAARFSFCRRQG